MRLRCGYGVATVRLRCGDGTKHRQAEAPRRPLGFKILLGSKDMANYLARDGVSWSHRGYLLAPGAKAEVFGTEGADGQGFDKSAGWSPVGVQPVAWFLDSGDAKIEGQDASDSIQYFLEIGVRKGRL